MAESASLAPVFTLSAMALALAIILYGFLASALPVWLLLAPRDYLSTFVKLGTIAILVIGIIAIRPTLQMPGLTRFINGTGLHHSYVVLWELEFIVGGHGISPKERP